MHKKIVTGAFTALLLLQPLSVAAVGTETATQASETANTEQKNSETTTAESASATEASATSSESVSSEEQPASTSASTSEGLTESSSSSTTSSSAAEKAPKAATNPHIPSYDGSGTPVDVTSVDYFQQNLVQKYPLGIGTQFTAFAGNNLNFTGQYSGINFDGTYAGSNMNFAFDGVNYFKHSDEYPTVDDWNYPFYYKYSDDSTEKSNPLTLIGNRYAGDGNLRAAQMVLTAKSNFQDQQSFLFENMNQAIPATSYDPNGNTAEERLPVQSNVGDVSDFPINLGVTDTNTLYSGTEYFSRSQEQLNTVSRYYKSFTDTIPAVGNSSIDPMIKEATYKDNEIDVEVPLIKSDNTKNGVAIFNLSRDVLGAYNSSVIKIKLDNVKASMEKKYLPFIIFNWNGWNESNWSSGTQNMIFVDGDGNEITDSNFFKKMGSHIIHNFPDVTGTLSLGKSASTNPFAGTVLVPKGSITLDNSSNTQDAFWGSLIAGRDITLKLPISKEKAFGSVFDADNLPSFDDMLLKLTFAQDTVTAQENQGANSLMIYGSSSDFAVTFTQKDAGADTPKLKVHSEKDTDGQDDEVLTGLALKEKTPFTVDTTGWEPGTYTIIGTITDWKDKGQGDTNQAYLVAQFTIIVPEPESILSLDAVPDLNFGSFPLGASGEQSELHNLSTFQVKSAQTFDGNEEGLITVTDTRNHNAGGNWSLKVAMTPFSRVGQNDNIDAQLTLNIQQENQSGIKPLTIQSESGAKPAFLLHEGGHEQSATEIFHVLTTAEGDQSSNLLLKDPVTNLGTYHSVLTWTLGDLPKSDELTEEK